MSIRIISVRRSASLIRDLQFTVKHQFRCKSTSPNRAVAALDFLRWKAASILTDSLPEIEQKELLRKLQQSATLVAPAPIDKANDAEENDSSVQQHSISEAIAKARADEAMKQQAKWDEERQKLTLEAEKAAQARVEQELAIHKQRMLRFQEWTKEVNGEKKEKESVDAAVVEIDNLDQHPVLGPVLSDFGYKRVHAVSAQQLASIPVWRKQRTFRHDRAKSMVKDKKNTLHLGFPGVIVLHEDSDGNLRIVDGQHRVGMMSLMLENSTSDVDLSNILVEVYPQHVDHGDNHAENLFAEINKAEPVKLIDMPGVAKVSERNIISNAAERLLNKFPGMFSDSQRCRAPNLNIDNLRDEIFAAKILTRHNIKSGAALEKWMLAQNELLQEKLSNSEELGKSFSDNQLQKANENKFYLGLDKSWYYN